MSKYNYYYNNVPGKGLCRNNLVYTSLMNEDQTEFIQWYYNDTEYHKGHNQVVDPVLMNQKWERELVFLQFMEVEAPNLIPKIITINNEEDLEPYCSEKHLENRTKILVKQNNEYLQYLIGVIVKYDQYLNIHMAKFLLVY